MKDLVIRIIRPWQNPNWLRQTPGGAGLWNGCQFTEEPIADPDVAIVCNYVDEEVSLHIAPDRLWLLVQEPPVPAYRWLRAGYGSYGRIFAPDPAVCRHASGHWTHGFLPWHVGKTFDELNTEALPEKSTDLTWITSNLAVHAGHRLRLQFLEKLQKQVSLQLFGRGFRPIADKWEALAPVRYALAIENHSCPHYWTEKVADCYLAGAMPIYWGATNLADYFPEESFCRIDIRDPQAPQRVAEIVRSDLAERNRSAILEARQRILEQHQFFPGMSRFVREHVAANPALDRRDVTVSRISDLTRYKMSTPLPERVWHSIRRRLRRGSSVS